MPTILLKTFLASTWAADNPVLLHGEPGLESDTGRLKIGANSAHWNDLPYVDQVNGYYDSTQIDTLLSGKSDLAHLHDDRYYTEVEVDALLAGAGGYGAGVNQRITKALSIDQVTTTNDFEDWLVQAVTIAQAQDIEVFATVQGYNLTLGWHHARINVNGSTQHISGEYDGNTDHITMHGYCVFPNIAPGTFDVKIQIKAFAGQFIGNSAAQNSYISQMIIFVRDLVT